MKLFGNVRENEIDETLIGAAIEVNNVICNNISKEAKVIPAGSHVFYKALIIIYGLGAFLLWDFYGPFKKPATSGEPANLWRGKLYLKPRRYHEHLYATLGPDIIAAG